MAELAETTQPPVEKPGIDRRGFLKGMAIGGGLVAASQLVQEPAAQRAAAKGGLEVILNNPGLLDPAVGALHRWMMIAANSELKAAGITPKENPNFHPLEKDIALAIKSFQNEGGNVTYQRSSAYRDEKFYQGVLRQTVNDPNVELGNSEDYWQPILGFKTLELVQQMINRVPRDAWTLFDFVEERDYSGYNSFLKVAHSGVTTRTFEQTGLPRNFGISNPNFDQDLDKLSNAIQDQLYEARDFVENEVATNGGKPIPISRVILHFLRQNNGELGRSLWDSTIFLKFMTRAYSNPESITPNVHFSDEDLQPGGDT